ICDCQFKLQLLLLCLPLNLFQCFPQFWVLKVSSITKATTGIPAATPAFTPETESLTTKNRTQMSARHIKNLLENAVVSIAKHAVLRAEPQMRKGQEMVSLHHIHLQQQQIQRNSRAPPFGLGAFAPAVCIKP
ncbi:unnamed protein product, partial [Prunus brigantina]